MILLFAGTSDALELMDLLVAAGLETTLSVATDYGKKISSRFGDRCEVHRLDQVQMENYIKDRNIDLVIDASHPFAAQVSRNAIQASQNTGIPYIRFEREQTNYPDDVIQVDSIAAACREADRVGGKVYLTTGSKSLADFLDHLPLDRLIVRILPTSRMMKRVEDLGFNAGQIHALQGPFSVDLNKELFTLNDCQVMITKDSGRAGGVQAKLEAARQAGLVSIVIRRPQIDYPEVYTDMEAVVQAARRHLEGRS